MQRDWDVIRDLLLEVEALEPNTGTGIPIIGRDADEQRRMNRAFGQNEDEDTKICDPERWYHARLLIDKGFLEEPLGFPDTHPREEVHLISLTWEGHELLDSIRDEEVWKQTREHIGSTVTSAALDIVTQVAKQCALGVLGIT